MKTERAFKPGLVHASIQACLLLSLLGTERAVAAAPEQDMQASLRQQLEELRQENKELKTNLLYARQIAALQAENARIRHEIMGLRQGVSPNVSAKKPMPKASAPAFARSAPAGSSEAVSAPASKSAVKPESATTETSPGIAFAGQERPRPVPPVFADTPLQKAPAAAMQATPPSDLDQTRQRIEARIGAIEAETSPLAGAGIALRERSGTPGLDQLSENRVQAHASGVMPTLGRVKVAVTNVDLDAGKLDAGDAAMFGQMPLKPGAGSSGPQQANGSALDMRVQHDNFSFNLGLSPRGFPVETLTGAVAWHSRNRPLAVRLSRAPVQDSLLSYAGLRDPVSGRIWGGVYSNAVEVSGTSGSEDARLSGSVNYARLQGQAVADNQRWLIYGALDKTLDADADNLLQVGVEMLGMHYQRNLSHFTYGQGGYFSPQRFVRANGRLRWSGKSSDDFAFAAEGRLGWQSFREADSPYFPNDPVLQARIIQAAFAGQQSSGLAYGLLVNGVYRVDPFWQVGAWAALDNSRDYKNQLGGLFARYAFRPQPALQRTSAQSKLDQAETPFPAR